MVVLYYIHHCKGKVTICYMIFNRRLNIQLDLIQFISPRIKNI